MLQRGHVPLLKAYIQICANNNVVSHGYQTVNNFKFVIFGIYIYNVYILIHF